MFWQLRVVPGVWGVRGGALLRTLPHLPSMWTPCDIWLTNCSQRLGSQIFRKPWLHTFVASCPPTFPQWSLTANYTCLYVVLLRLLTPLHNGMYLRRLLLVKQLEEIPGPKSKCHVFCNQSAPSVWVIAPPQNLGLILRGTKIAANYLTKMLSKCSKCPTVKNKARWLDLNLD